MSSHLRVIVPGLSSTIQDAGRFGLQRFGVPTSGAMDRVAMAAANCVVGNPPDMAVIEMLYLGASLDVEADSIRVACAGLGAALELTHAERTWQVPGGESVRLVRGDRLRVVVGPASISCVLAIEGGLALTPLMGSLSTLGRARMGGLDGRALIAGDCLPLVRGTVDERPAVYLPQLDLSVPERIRIVWGPQDDYFTHEARDRLLSESYEVTRAADRMGLRLSGPPLVHAKGSDIVSDGIAPGSIQVPGDGQPIILLADRQTTGGYPKIATVASVDVPALGRVAPGAKLKFAAISIEEAQECRRAQAQCEAKWASKLAPALGPAGLREDALYSANLISGVARGDEHEGL